MTWAKRGRRKRFVSKQPKRNQAPGFRVSKFEEIFEVMGSTCA
jgi:hypothetical protein